MKDFAKKASHSRDGRVNPGVAVAIAVVGVIGVFAALIAWKHTHTSGGNAGTLSTPGEPSVDNPPGAVIVDAPWDHLHHIDNFELTNQHGEPFDTAQFSGNTPFLVSFFFATCPTICRDLNRQIAELNEQLKKENVAFVTITVDPERDTVDVLDRYAEDFGAVSPRWSFLRGQQYQFKAIGEQMFRVEVVDMLNHTDNIMLVDKWGKYRDRFKWDEPYDMKRLVKVVKQVAAETQPPLHQTIRTRNAMVGREPIDLSTIRYIREFHLYTSDEEPFFSRDLTGEVWITNFFFISCPTICRKQNKYLADLQHRLGDHPTKIVSITTQPEKDLPENLREHAAILDADPDRWVFLTGNEKAIPRIAAEFFGAMGTADHHSSELFVVDKWGNVRGRFDWRKPDQESRMLELIDSLWLEPRPPGDFEILKGGSTELDSKEPSDEATENDDD